MATQAAINSMNNTVIYASESEERNDLDYQNTESDVVSDFITLSFIFLIIIYISGKIFMSDKIR